MPRRRLLCRQRSDHVRPWVNHDQRRTIVSALRQGQLLQQRRVTDLSSWIIRSGGGVCVQPVSRRLKLRQRRGYIVRRHRNVCSHRRRVNMQQPAGGWLLYGHRIQFGALPGRFLRTGGWV